MRRLGTIDIQFIPGGPYPDDPMPQNAYLAWKAIIKDPDRDRQYGAVTVLGFKPDMTFGELSVFLQQMDEHLRALLGMTPEEVAEHDAEIQPDRAASGR